MERSAPPERLPELPAALTSHVGYLSVVMGQRSHERFEVAMDKLGLRPIHYDYLATLAASGPMSQRELARILDVDAARIVGLTDELAQRGLVDRSVDGADRRRNVLTLTRSGRALYAKAGKAAAGVEADLLTSLTADEQVTLRALLRKALDI